MDPRLSAILARYGLDSVDEQALGRMPGHQVGELQTELLALARELETADEIETDVLADVVDAAGTVLDVIESHDEIVTAAATRVADRASRLRARRPASMAPRIPATPRSNIVAAGGHRVGDVAELAQLLAAGLRDADRLTVGAIRVASIEASRQVARLGVDTMANEATIARTIAEHRDALVAAGGVCAPTQALYDLPVIPSEARPVRDALTQFLADRGGVRFVAPPTLADVAGGVDVWTHANDVNPADPATKPIVTMTCGDDVEVLVSAITARMLVGNFRARFNPESVAQWLTALLAAQARLAEQTLLQTLVSDSVAATAATVLGTARDVLAVLDRAGAAYRSRQRLDAGAQLIVILPSWVRDQMRADLTRQHPGDQTLAVDDSRIAQMFAARHFSVAWSIDWQEFPAQVDGDALRGWPSTCPALIFAPGTWLFLDGGVLELGVVRDSTLNQTNDAEIFSETFEEAAFVGTESLALTLDTCPDGSSSASVDISPCTSGS